MPVLRRQSRRRVLTPPRSCESPPLSHGIARKLTKQQAILKQQIAEPE